MTQKFLSNNFKVILGSFLITALSLLLSSNASALTVSPAKLELDLKSNNITTGSFRIINSEKKDIKVKIYSTPYSVVNDEYQPDFEKSKFYTKLSDWIKIDEPKITIKKGESKKIDFEVKTPSNIPDGSQYATIMTEVIQNNKNKANINVKSRIGMVIYAKTNGKNIESGVIDKINSPFLQSKKFLNINSSIKNTGNTEFNAQTQILIKDLFGNTKLKQDNTYTVLPYSTRKISFQTDRKKGKPFGLFKVEIKNNFLKQKHSETHYILSMPIPILVVSIVALLSLIIALVLVLKKKK